MSGFQDPGFEDLYNYNCGLERAAEHLMAKAVKMRNQPNVSSTADTMARIFEAEAAEVLALRRST